MDERAQVYAVFGETARVTTTACPLQVEGTHQGQAFYFRARGGRWTLGIGPDNDAAVDASMSQFAPFGSVDCVWSDAPDPLSSHGSPEPDDQVTAGTFGRWLLAELERCRRG